MMVNANPGLASAISDALRDADSFVNLHYYSQTASLFVAADGSQRYARYRLIPADGRMQTGFIDPTKLTPGKDHVPRQFGDFRSTRYLRDDFRHRVQNGGVRYRLQVQFHGIVEDDRSALDATQAWPGETCPWQTIGVVELDSLVAADQEAALRFNPGNTRASLAAVTSDDPSDPASLLALRIKVYQQASAWRSRTLPDDPKSRYPYRGEAGVDLPNLDPYAPLPPEAMPTAKYMARFGMFRLPGAHPESPPEPLLGVMGVTEVMGANFSKWMPANLTRMRDDKYSDSFFCLRRLNGFNAGKLKRVHGHAWEYEVNYSTRGFVKEPGGMLPERISARFSLNGEQLRPHGILWTHEGELHQNGPADGEDWDLAKRIFRCTEFVFTQAQTHLARCHMNVEQYAMAAARNFVNNPVALLLRPHVEGTMYINKLGSNLIAGPSGIITVASPLDATAVDAYLLEEIRKLCWRWQPARAALPDPIRDNHYDRAALAMWDVVATYVGDFFKTHGDGIKSAWAEVEGFSQDLVTHSITEPKYGAMAVEDMGDLRQLCTYVIFMATFAHSWTNGKLWDDGADPEYATIGMWDKDHPAVDPYQLARVEAAQVGLSYNLAKVHYNPIMEVGPPKLRQLLTRARAAIEPGIALEDIMLSINI